MRNDPCHCGSGRRYKECHGSLLAIPEKVAFLIAGTQKGGTTALASYLQEHPAICMSTVKEVHFFDTEEFFASGDVDYTRYHARFNPTARKRLLGEATPIYMYWEAAAHRIQRYNPTMKLILLLRNPVTRAYSHWNHEHARGRLNLRSSRRSVPRKSGAATRCRCRPGGFRTSIVVSTASKFAGSGASSPLSRR